MRYHVLATDYDGTLARDGTMADATWAALHRLRDSGRQLVMVTGRRLDGWLAQLREPQLFARIVAENGALLYRPATEDSRVLAPPPPPRFLAELRSHGVDPLVSGRVIVATLDPHLDTVLRAIRELDLELQVILNRDAVMVLPAGVNKATGLAAALDELGLPRSAAVGVGDAENDQALLAACGLGVAVGNALPELKDAADLVVAGVDGDGVIELVDRLIASDLAEVAPRRNLA